MTVLLTSFLLALLVCIMLLMFTDVIVEENSYVISEKFMSCVYNPICVLTVIAVFVATYISGTGNVKQAIREYDPAIVFADWEQLSDSTLYLGRDKVSYAYHTIEYEHSNNRSKLEDTHTSKKNPEIMREGELYAVVNVHGGWQYTFHIKNDCGKIVSEYVH